MAFHCKVKCSSCKESKFTNPQAYEARIAKYGSLEEVEKKWICRDCKEGIAPEDKESGEDGIRCNWLSMVPDELPPGVVTLIREPRHA
jgi:hypothetical protein